MAAHVGVNQFSAGPAEQGLSLPASTPVDNVSIEVPAKPAVVSPKKAAPDSVLPLAPRIAATSPTLVIPVERARASVAADVSEYRSPSSESPVLVRQTRIAGDDLPVLPAVSNIRPQTLVSELRPPSTENQSIGVSQIPVSATPEIATPDLFETTPTDFALKIEGDALVPIVFSDGVEKWPDHDAPNRDAVANFPVIDLPLIRSFGGSGLISPDTLDKLPTVGPPPEGPRSLAAKLGFVGDDTANVSLVTYAPRNVTSEVLGQYDTILKETGFPTTATNRVDFKVSQTHVRFYNTRDARVAQAIAGEVGGDARDFSKGKSDGASGRIEVWLEGNSPVRAVAKKPKRVNRTAQRAANAKAQLRNRLANTLRRGEHLGR